MTHKTSKPAPLCKAVTGLGNGISSAATSRPENSARGHLDQSAFAVDLIARRFRVTHATARANAEAFGFGGCR